MSDKKQTKSVLSQSTTLTSGSAMALGALMAKDAQSKRKKSVGKSKDVQDTNASVEGASAVTDTAPISDPVEQRDTRTRNSAEEHEGVASVSEVPKERATSRKNAPDAAKSVLSQSTELKSGSAMALASLMAKDTGKRSKDVGKVKEPQKVVSEKTSPEKAVLEIKEKDDTARIGEERIASAEKPIEPLSDIVDAPSKTIPDPATIQDQQTVPDSAANAAKPRKRPDMTKSVLSQSTTLRSGNAMVLESLVAKTSSSRKAVNSQKDSDVDSVAVPEVSSQQITNVELDNFASIGSDSKQVQQLGDSASSPPDAVQHIENTESEIWKEAIPDRSGDTVQLSPVLPSQASPCKVDWGPKENRLAGPHRNLVEIAPKGVLIQSEKHILYPSAGADSREKICSWKCCSQTDNYEMELYSRPRHAKGAKHEADSNGPSTFFQRYCEQPFYQGSMQLRECTDELGEEVFNA